MMNEWLSLGIILILQAMLPAVGAADGPPDGATLYREHCAECHGGERLGGMGPALVPENLTRLKRPAAARAIADGLPATQMPPFGQTLSQAEITALVEYIYTPLPALPSWGEDRITATHVVRNRPETLPAKPIFAADPLNLFLVVELGDHHVTVLDGDRLEPIHRFPTHRALHGGPKFSPDGRFVYLASRDGWIEKYDLYGLKPVAEIRAGINSRNLAVSGDGRYVMVANYLPHNLVLLDARDLSLIKVIEVTDGHGRSSRVSAVYSAPPRQSFIAALKDLPEVWEISYATPPPYYGPVHDHRDEGPLEEPQPFPVRRIHLDDYLDDFFFDQAYRNLIGAGRNAKNGQVINLDAGRKIAAVDLPAMPHLGSGITWQYQGRPVLATPHLEEALVSVIDMETWKTIKEIKTLGPGFFMRSHENSAYAWVDVFFGPNKDAVHVIDKGTLEIVKTLRPAPGKTGGHVEYDRYGKYVLVSVWDMDGAIVVYDARTLNEIKRIPMKKPSGKYNVYNKITRSTGTSH